MTGLKFDALLLVLDREVAQPRYTLSLQWRPECSYTGPVTVRAAITINNTTRVQPKRKVAVMVGRNGEQ